MPLPPPASASSSSSPIAELLSTLGMSREDLGRHASQMRQFLDTESTKSTRAHSQAPDHPLSTHRQHSETPSYLFTHDHSQQAPHRDTVSLPTRLGHHGATPTPPPQPHVADYSRSRSSSRRPSARHADYSDHSPEQSSAWDQRKHERRRAHAAVSPSRLKPSLDEIMQMRSRESQRVSESSESEDSGAESLREVFARRHIRATSPHYRYPHPARTMQPSTGSNYYRQDSPTIQNFNGKYYRNRDTHQLPVTPQTNRHVVQVAAPHLAPTLSQRTNPYYRQLYASTSDLPPFSPAQQSSPISSPIRYPVNLVSSPGLMSDPPDQYDTDLPYTLPPGPYLDEKPDLSYAALIGQAILASPHHALRLKDIYDYISIVYPFFKRDGHSHSQKWMNAIRQNLTNTPQFFKRDHPCGKQAKGSLWCISDENLPCFANGGYNRHALNPDSSQSEKAEKRKRKKEEKQRQEKAKKTRVAPPVPNPFTFPYGYPQTTRSSLYDQPTEAQVQADLIFPPLPADHPNAHLVNRAWSSSESVDEDVLFPPLPAFSQTRIVREQRMHELSRQSSTSSLAEDYSLASSQAASDDESFRPVSVPPMSSASSSSVPDLTPNNSSSSPPEPEEDDNEDDELAYIKESALTKTQSDNEEHCDHLTWEDKAEDKAVDALSFPRLPPEPSSPTTSRRGHLMRSPSTSLYAGSGFLGYTRDCAALRPSTPPNDYSAHLEGSLTMTPIARRNPPTTPTRNKDHFGASKSSDEYVFGGDARPTFFNAIPRTPSRRPAEDSSGAGPSTLPETPRRIFSPFGIFSPFRTPSRRGIFDPADPGVMLDEELSALSSAKQRANGPQDSPVGFFPRGKGLLYESPNLPSPGKWKPW